MAEFQRRRFGLEEISPPFSLVLSEELPANIRELHCQQIYRHLPGKRLVCAATWAGKQVFVKIYYHRWRAKSHWRREERGLRLLLRCGIATPPLLRSQYVRDRDCYVLILGAIAPARTFGEVWNQSSGAADRRDLLNGMVRVFAELHGAGLIQSDPHFNNFLVSGDRVYTLDGSDIGRLRPFFAKQQALANLAVFCAIFPSAYGDLASGALIEYFKLRRWAHSQRDSESFIQLIASVRERNERNYFQRKIFRECTPFVARRSWSSAWACDRRFYTPSMKELLRAPDKFLASHAQSFLKQGQGATVAVVQADDLQLVVKHYHARNRVHAFRRAFGKTRAARSWSNAHRLRICGVATAEPVAWIEERFGPFRRASYFLSRYMAGPHLLEFLGSGASSNTEQIEMAEQVVNMLNSLGRCRIVHGDLKATNIIVHEGQPVLMDLDAMCYFGKRKAFVARFAEDLKRFMRNWENNEHLEQLFRNRLSRLPDDVRPGSP
jgi:tRNA A-37 threonylcarbamoyl transferase component Bud32